MKIYPIFYLILLLFLPFVPANGQNHKTNRVDSVYNSMTTEQRIAQLFMMRAYSCNDSIYNDSIDCLVELYQPGGFCFFKGSPVKQANLVNRLQQTAKVPLLIAIDAEWGLGMRLDSAPSFPRQMALGAIRDDSLIYRMGRIVGRDCRRLGVHFNFAPVADVNNNPLNPVISFRSFGEKPDLVARKSIMYMKGMQDAGIMTSGKHFPGHGDTDNDSHYTLPVINHPRQRLDSVELYPFRALIKAGIKGIMVAHLYVTALDTASNTATTLSEPVITQLLKEKMGFKGFVVTDALDMQGVTRYFKPGEIELKALQAGNDILLLPQHIDQAVAGIRTALDSGWISPELIESKCKRILELKESLGLLKKPFIQTKTLIRDINLPETKSLANKMVKQSLTLLGNSLRMVPLTNLDKRKIAVLSTGDTSLNVFQSTLMKYSPVTIFRLPKNFSDSIRDSLLRQLSPFDIVITGIHGISSSPGTNFGVTGSIQKLTDTLSIFNRTIMVVFGTPYALNAFQNAGKAEAVIVTYQDNDFTQTAAAEAIFGGFPLSGNLPVTTTTFPYGSGEETVKCRLETVFPEEIGLQTEKLKIIDSIILDGIDQKAFPGCQVLAAKGGRIFYEKAFGTPAYDDSSEVKITELYDLASVTKIAATTLAIMKLYDQGMIRLTDTLGKFLPELKGSNKSGLKIGDVMAHQAGLADWIPFYRATLNKGEPDSAIYNREASEQYPVEVCEGMYISKDYQDTIYNQIIHSPLRIEKGYKYSDLGFYLLKKVVEKSAGQPFEIFLDDKFYKPLGLTTLTFNPLKKNSRQNIIPTENDLEFRKQLVWGYVHDPGAAMLGGISGHAGLFSNSRDLAVIMQMLLNKGNYGDKEYLKPSTVAEFTKTWNPGKSNRRGVGFDKPPVVTDPTGPVCRSASSRSYGHSGFTGTYVWADPSNDLVYIFLSNRICPDANNQKLSMLNIRTNIHQAIYDILQKLNSNN